MGIQVTRQWLDTIVDTPLTNEAIGAALTQAGLELDALTSLDPGCDGVVVGYVEAVDPHPNADKLRVCTVNVGEAEPLTIVCGCPTAQAGMFAAVATIGTTLPGGLRIKKSKLRGVHSCGMLCSASELGLPSEQSGILHLSADSIIGQDIAVHLGLDDTVMDFDITPNRGDCLSLHGVARELIAVSTSTWKPDLSVPTLTETVLTLDVDIQVPDSVGAYSLSRIDGVQVATQSKQPLIRSILEKIGVGSVNSIVDVVNYTMFREGQPYHAFDADKVHGKITVRTSTEGESLVLLNGETISLDNDTIIIADAEKVLAIAGVMGGASSAVDEHTTNILLETAYFTPASVAKACRRYNLHSDSAYRFERGVDYGRFDSARACAIHALIQEAGGIYKGHYSSARTIAEVPAVYLHAAEIHAVLGITVSHDQVEHVLNAIGASWEAQSDCWVVHAPTWRHDLKIAVDYIEEIVRFIGFERLSTQEMVSVNLSSAPSLDKKAGLDQALGYLVSHGFHEIISYSFISEAEWALFAEPEEKLCLLNPISAHMSHMRTSLLPGLLKTVAHNQKRQKHQLRLCETGQVFDQAGNTRLAIAGCISGKKHKADWQVAEKAYSFYDAKGLVEGILRQRGIHCESKPVDIRGMHPGKTAGLYAQDSGEWLGFVGTLHPEVYKSLSVQGEVWVFSLQAAPLLQPRTIQYKPYSKFPSVRRDLSILLTADHTYEDVLQAITLAKNPHLQAVELFDYYTGEKIKKDEKSLAISFIFQDHTKTLLDNEVNDVMDNIIEQLKQLNMYVRV